MGTLDQEYFEAHMVNLLYAAEGMENKDIAARLDTSFQIVCKWRKRFFEHGLEGLQEGCRRGRPPRFSPRGRRRD